MADPTHAHDALRERDRDVRVIIDAIPAMAWSADPDGSATFFNRHYLEILGLSTQEACGWGWTAAVHPEDMDGLAAVWQRCLGTGEPGEAEARLRRHDGEYRWFLFRANPLRDAAGKIVQWYGVNTDIEDRKRAEADLRRAYDHLTEAQRLSKTGSFTADPGRREYSWSEEFYRICGIEPGASITLGTLQHMTVPEDVPVCVEALQRSMSGLEAAFECRIVTPQGAVKHLRGIAHRMEHIRDHAVIMGAVQDITAIRNAEAALNEIRAELAHVSRVTTLSTLTASITHEVNQPLSGIIANAGTCLRVLTDHRPNLELGREAARRIIRDGNRAAAVVARLRDMFGRREFALQPMDLNEATREVIALSLGDLQRERVTIQPELADDLPAVNGDRIQLQQVVLNLVRNASEAMADV
ncbi:MAG TPA: PAS domain-containing protein, partial [Ramlibacter sp.]|nr:PAS domain-containing protein [Ramlibacter sp.]